MSVRLVPNLPMLRAALIEQHLGDLVFACGQVIVAEDSGSDERRKAAIARMSRLTLVAKAALRAVV